jgi:capsular polysaccharide biosynthesis protein
MSTNDPTTIDLGSWLITLVRSWWLILGLVVLGVVVGGIVTLASAKEYSATSAVYIGQTTDANGNAIPGLNSNGTAASKLLASQTLLDEAAKRTGMQVTASRLRRETTTSVVNIVVITVTDTNKRRAAAAANALAAVLVERISPGVDERISLLEAQLSSGNKAFAASLERSGAAQVGLVAIARGSGTAAEKAAASAPYVAIVQVAADEQGALVSSNQKTELMLFTAKLVEQPRILYEAATPDSLSASSLSRNVAAGALAGLVIGIVVALVRRLRAERSAAEQLRARELLA